MQSHRSGSAPSGYHRRQFEESVNRIYGLLDAELDECAYEPWEVDMINSPKLYYGDYLNLKTRSYTIGRLAHNISRSLEHLAIPLNGRPYRIVDVGCGLGQQSFLFGLHGASVVGIDLNEPGTQLAARRKLFYEKKFQRNLEVSFIGGNFLDVAGTLAPDSFDAAFSMSAFIHIQPLHQTVSAIARLVRPGGKVVIWDLNSAYLIYRILGGYRKNLPQPSQVCEAFSKLGFRIDLLTGGAAIPSPVWIDRLGSLLNRASNLIAERSLRLSYNFFLSATKIEANQA